MLCGCQVDKKAAQLKAISHLAALIAGFSMVVLVEALVGDDVPTILVAAFGLSAACVVRARGRAKHLHHVPTDATVAVSHARCAPGAGVRRR